MGIKTVTAKVQNNIVGSIAGAGLAWWATKKYTSVSGTWKMVGIALLGAVAGAYAQSMIQAKASTPKKTDVKK